MDESFADTDLRNREAWNAAHSARSHGALSGSLPENVLDHHRIARTTVRPGLVVLDIGVGLGGMAQFLQAEGCVVDALDVADTAEQYVRQHIRRFYLAENIETLPSDEYDLAVSMIVSQHMCERNLRKQIEHVFRALKPGGLFSLHLAGGRGDVPNDIAGPIPYAMDGAMCRTPDYAMTMIGDVLKTGYEATLLDHRMEWPKFNSYWYFVHIRKATP